MKPVRRISAADGVDVGVGVGVDVGVDVGVEEAICSWFIDEATSSRRLAGLKKDSPVGKSTVYHMLAWMRWASLGSAPGGRARVSGSAPTPTPRPTSAPPTPTPCALTT